MISFLEIFPTYQELKAELDDAYHRVMDSGWYLTGKEVEAFEQEFARYCGTKHCVAVGSGLDALHFAIRAHGIGIGDEATTKLPSPEGRASAKSETARTATR